MIKNLKKLLKVIKVYDCRLTKIRIGNKSDGGYIALKEICNQTKTVLSVGIEDNVSFDLDFINNFPKANIKLYDYSIEKLPIEHKRFQFYKYRISSKNSNYYKTLELENLTEDCDNRTLLKMDIEWDEWNVLDKINSRTLNLFNQILLEIHIIHIDTNNNFMLNNKKLSPYFSKFYLNVYNQINDNLFSYYYKILKKIQKYFYIFHIHANNSLQMVEINNISFPPLLELSFVRKDLVKKAKITNEIFPITGLDYPNKSYRSEITKFYP